MQKPDGPSEPLNSEARYRLLVDAVTDYAIFMLDPDGFVVSWNSGAQRLKGYSEQEIVGQHFSRFYSPDDLRAKLPAHALDVAARVGRFEAEGWRVKQNGDRFWAHVVIDPIRAPDRTLLGFAKVTRDLTERRAAEESLRRSEEQFRLLVQGVTDYAIYMLSPEGIVTNWNAGAQRIKGYLPSEVVGTHFSRFFLEADRQAGLPGTALATAAAEGRFESEGWRLRRDGTRFWANAVVDPIRDADGRIIGFAKITRDMTEKRNAQLALDRAREELFQAQKLEAIGQLTGGVAHDFNNLLMVVLNSLELLRRRNPDDEKANRLIDNAVHGVKRGVTLTQRMLSFARRQALSPVCVDPRALVQGMRELIQGSIGPTIRVVLDFPDQLRSVMVDANQLELALLNLALNARDAMPQGGALKISAQEVKIAAGAAAQMDEGDYVCLSITDSGNGMSDETLAHAMEPFFTTKGPGKGTGLGLPMVHGLAAQSGGRFVLRSTQDVGTTAELWLPIAPVDVEPAASVASEGGGAAFADDSPMVVVAVDDDELVLAGTVAMLEEMGHTVLPATSAQQALDLIEAGHRIDLVITDHAMPGLTGIELIARLASDHPEVATILATGFADALEGSGQSVPRLAKPFDQQDLADRIRQARPKAADRSVKV